MIDGVTGPMDRTDVFMVQEIQQMASLATWRTLLRVGNYERSVAARTAFMTRRHESFMAEARVLVSEITAVL